MGEQGTATCPGCGAVVPISAALADGRFTAADECRQRCGVLLDDPFIREDADFPYQTVVDAYGAQHASLEARPIGVAFALIGLHLKFERGFTGKQVQRAHAALARRTKAWPYFSPPAERGRLTVLDVVRQPPGEARLGMLDAWALAVWRAWAAEHGRVAALVATYLPPGWR